MKARPPESKPVEKKPEIARQPSSTLPEPVKQSVKQPAAEPVRQPSPAPSKPISENGMQLDVYTAGLSLSNHSSLFSPFLQISMPSALPVLCLCIHDLLSENEHNCTWSQRSQKLQPDQTVSYTVQPASVLEFAYIFPNTIFLAKSTRKSNALHWATQKLDKQIVHTENQIEQPLE